MYLELDDIFGFEGKSIGIEYVFSLDDERALTPVRVKGRVFNKTGIVKLDAIAEFDYSAVCDRCGKPILGHAAVKVEHVLLPETENKENDDFIILDGARLNLDGLVREDIYLAAPSKFLCREDCKGLCSICGTDLNVSKCNCKAPPDERFDMLKNILTE